MKHVHIATVIAFITLSWGAAHGADYIANKEKSCHDHCPAASGQQKDDCHDKCEAAAAAARDDEHR